MNALEAAGAREPVSLARFLPDVVCESCFNRIRTLGDRYMTLLRMSSDPKRHAPWLPVAGTMTVVEEEAVVAAGTGAAEMAAAVTAALLTCCLPCRWARVRAAARRSWWWGSRRRRRAAGWCWRARGEAACAGSGARRMQLLWARVGEGR